LNAIRLSGASLDDRNEALRSLNEAGYQSRPIWEPMHRLPMFNTCPRSELDVTEKLRLEIVNLPSSVILAKSK
jgi:perosamine synthetase